MPKGEKPVHELVAPDGSAFPLKKWARPGKTVSEFKVKVKNKNVDCVTTKGEKYTYLNVDGVDYYVDTKLDEGKSYKVREIKYEEAAAE